VAGRLGLHCMRAARRVVRPVAVLVAATLVVSLAEGAASTSGPAPSSSAAAAPEPATAVSERPDLVSAGLAARRQGVAGEGGVGGVGGVGDVREPGWFGDDGGLCGAGVPAGRGA
jgi:hypothetical protein